MSDQTAPQSAPMPHSQLEHFPVTFFATVMGLAGFSLALHYAEELYALPHVASGCVLVLAVLDLLVALGLYVIKALRYPQAVAAEWRHPVKLAFFPAITIGLLLVATGIMKLSQPLAEMLWIIASLGQAGLTLAVISGWIGKRPFQPVQMSPAWFIPAVGNVVVPLVGVPLGYVEISWLFFSTGMMFWVILLTLVMNRLIFHDPLPGKLLPTLTILIAPPAVGFLAWLQLNGGVLDPFGRMLYYSGVTFAAIVALQARTFAQLPFALSFWALSFPVAALTLATLRYGELAKSDWHAGLGLGLLGVLIVLLGGLVLRTAKAALRNEICQPERP